MPQTAAIILAAGQGTRMKSNTPKVLHKLLGKPMLKYVVDAARTAGADPVMVVVGFGGDQVQTTIGSGVEYIWQKERLGTGHAILIAKEQLAQVSGDLLVLYGDTPLISSETLTALIKIRQAAKAAAAVLTVQLEAGGGYGRIIRDCSGQITGIVEAKDANPAQLAINEVNTGIYCFAVEPLLQVIEELTPANAQGEYYLTDVIKLMVGRGMLVTGMAAGDAAEMMGPNDRLQLAQTERHLKRSINQHWMLEGVTLVDPEFTYIGPDVVIGCDTIIHPGTILQGKTVIGGGCELGPHTSIVDAVIGDKTMVKFSQIIEAEIGQENIVGPYTYIRPGTISAAKVKFGDFVEVKNCQIGTGSKVPHLTYLGDAEVGSGVNIGAGTITCNYDGLNKHRTVIKDRAFVGSNANLVAPVVVGAESTIAAGSTITKEVPDGALAVARNRQEIKLDWAKRKILKEDKNC